MENKESTRKRNSNLAAKAKDITDETWLQIEKDIANLSEKEFYNKWECSPSGINKYLLQWKAKKEVEGQFKDKLTQKDQKIGNLKDELKETNQKCDDLKKEIEALKQENEKLQILLEESKKAKQCKLTYAFNSNNNVRASIYVDKDVLAEWREKSRHFQSQATLITTCMKHFMDHHWPDESTVFTPVNDDTTE